MKKIKDIEKKGLSTIISVLLIIGLAIVVIFIVYLSVKNIAEDEFEQGLSCLDAFAISQSFFIKDSCYLNDQEILVDIERKSDVLDVKSIKLGFYGEEEITKWLIRDKKCSDVRTMATRYGGYCNVPGQNSEILYVFNVSDLERKKKVSLVIVYQQNNKERLCIIDTKAIDDAC